VSAMPLRVYLLDDHEIVRRGLRELLEDAGIDVIGDTGSAIEAAKRIPAMKPDVAVLDGRLPDGSGIDVCRDVRSIDPSIACVILTSYDDDKALVGAVMAGASGYLLKEIGAMDIVDAVTRAARGESLMDPALIERVKSRLAAGPAQDPRLADLGPREQQVLLLIGEGMTNRQIAEHLHLAEKTVKNYVSGVLAKLGLEHRTQAAVYITRSSTSHG
jgi:two-component system, NarL family, response regulator DevR